MKHRIGFVWIALFVALLWPRPASALFHFMQIDQAIGGVNGDPNSQAVQLSMRALGNNLLGGNARLRAYDATAANFVLLTDFLPLNNPTNSGACRQILIASSAFLSKTSPATTADYPLQNLIPASYFAGGSLTFENAITGAVLWRLSWGNYSGPQTTDLTNGDGTANPAAAGSLPAAGNTALHLGAAPPACPISSTDNLSQYSLTIGAATFKNNANSSFTVLGLPIPSLTGGAKLLLPALLGLAALGFAFLRRRSA